MADAVAIAGEQDHFDRAFERRERSRQSLQDAPRHAAGPRAGVAQVKRGADKQLAAMPDINDAVAFGRIDTEAGTFYIGKHGILDDATREPLVVNWKMPLVEPFYRATVVDPLGVTLKRQFVTERNTVKDFDDIVFGHLAERFHELTQAEETGVDDAVLRELDTDRTGSMQDIVKTIHAAQYELIRTPIDTVLLVQGGPGTGKTVVALHRVSWLLFNYRDRLSADRVLVVGPNPTFTRYISDVLPGLGDSEVAHRHLRNLGPQSSDRRDEDDDTARLKGELRMAELLRRGLRQRIRLGDGDALEVGGATGAKIPRAMAQNALNNAADAASYNAGRGQFRGWLSSRAPQHATNRAAVTPAAIESTLERVWPSLTAAAFLRDLLGSRDRLVAAAGDDFTAGDIARLHRPAAARQSDERWSDADVALLDEANEVVGGAGATFDHIVVDEAQDLSPMQLRSVRRRCSIHGSMTIVGDLGQGTAPWSPESWDDVARPLLEGTPYSYQELELGYRVPRQVYELAATLLPQIAPSLTPPRVVRDGPADPVLVETTVSDIVADVVHAASNHAGKGRFVGIVAPECRRAEILEELRVQDVKFTDARHGQLGTSINLCSPDEAKGLEFDAVVVADPEAIGEEGPRGLRKLYVALTRTTRYLTVVHHGTVLPLGTQNVPGGGRNNDPGHSAGEVLRAPDGIDPASLSGNHPPKGVGGRATQLVVQALARAIAEDIRATAAPTVWADVLEHLRTELALPADAVPLRQSGHSESG